MSTNFHILNSYVHNGIEEFRRDGDQSKPTGSLCETHKAIMVLIILNDYSHSSAEKDFCNL
jgi:hypothetical protein